MMTGTVRISETRTPSIAIQISKSDGERIWEASQALTKELNKREACSNNATTSSTYELLYSTAQQCDHPMLVQFLERIANAGLKKQEQKGAVLLFDESNKSIKLQLLFELLSKHSQKTTTTTTPSDVEVTSTSMSTPEKPKKAFLDFDGTTSLFRTVLVAITSCMRVHTTSSSATTTLGSSQHSHCRKDVIVEGQLQERPCKQAKYQHNNCDATVSTKDITEDDSDSAAFQSPSWDSSLATVASGREEVEQMDGLRKDIEEVALSAAQHLIQFASEWKEENNTAFTQNVMVDFITFSKWYNEYGTELVPWIELLQLSKWKAPPKEKNNTTGTMPTAAATGSTHAATCAAVPEKQYSTDSSPGSLATEVGSSRTLVSFDFNSSDSPTPLLINITEDNLHALKVLVQRTLLMQRTAVDISKTILQASCPRLIHGKDTLVLRKDDFRDAIRIMIPSYIFAGFSEEEQHLFYQSLLDFFSCFEESFDGLQEGEVLARDFAVGFCFLCSGNKSTKLAVGYELLDSKRYGYLMEGQLLHYLQAYLTMLVGISILSPIDKQKRRRSPWTSAWRKTMHSAIESGAKWTLRHYLKASDPNKKEYMFECFASWYSKGGYNIAPWLELLDLTKVFSLIADPSNSIDLPPLEMTKAYQTTERRPRVRDRVSSLRRHHSMRRSPPEILFTFPLSHHRSLVVLKEDAIYVRAVVEHLGLLTIKPDILWEQLSRAVEKSRKPTLRQEPAVYVNMETFVRIMKNICPRDSRKRSAGGDLLHGLSSSSEEVLCNFFQCFDIDRVDSVALDELMGGLTLLCGGKKSHKLAFAFSIFDTRQGVVGIKRDVAHSLSGEDLFLFLRSVLIVTFSICRQSLDLTDDMVGRCIAETANMICNDVMRHQWETKQMDRLDFDEFGQWYNDGGFERAPWLELLDLKKWVLVDEFNLMETHIGGVPPIALPPLPPPHRVMPPPPIASMPSQKLSILPEPNIPFSTPDESLDQFFEEDAIMNMDSMDEMDMILMQSTNDREDYSKISKSFSYGQSPRRHQASQHAHRRGGNPLKFHLHTGEHDGYMLSLSQARIRHFRHILESSGLHQVESETACNTMLSDDRPMMTRHDFDTAIRSLLLTKNHERHIDVSMAAIFDGIFKAFDPEEVGEANAHKVACGFTVLCRGKKSDKLEFAFEVLNKNKGGNLSQSDITNYLQSFLSVLLSIAFSKTLDNDIADDSVTTMMGQRCDPTTKTLIRAAKGGAEWAASLAFRDIDQNKKSTLSFDDFADWYTSVGYTSIPWLELLDLQKWAMLPENR